MSLSRQQAFQQLRPPCVALSSVALRFKGRQAPLKDVLYALQDVSSALTLLGEQNALDEKLAQYAFFPLTHVFNEAQRLSSSCLEVAIKCVIVLVTQGWRQHLSPDLAKQLLILMTLVSLPDARGESVEEVKAVALECIAAVLLQLSRRQDKQHLFDDASTKSLLDQLVYMILDAIPKSESERVQLAAADALYCLLTLVSNRVLLAAVLPSTASTLTKVLRKSPSARRTKKVLVSYLRVLRLLLYSVLADAVVYPLADEPSEARGGDEGAPLVLGASWLRATGGQVKLVLVQVTKLRFHESGEVRSALAELCLMVARDCATSLSQSTSVVVQTLLYIGSQQEGKALSVEVETLAISDRGIAEVIRSNFERNCASLPRVLAGHDEQPKGRILGELASSVTLLQQILSPRTEFLNTLTSSLLAISTDVKGAKVCDQEISIVPLADPSTVTRSRLFPQLTVGPFYQKDILSKLQLLLSACSACGLSNQVARQFIDRVEGQPAEEQATAIWFALSCLRLDGSGDNSGKSDDDDLALDDILDFENNDSDATDSRSHLISDLYVSVLPFLQDEGGPDTAVDAQLKALAIECTVLQAEQLKVSYRPELVDSLYPILALLGSQNLILRTHAITGLNLLAQACGYPSASDMLVDNVDYLINAVALKLNSFDVSPQAPQVVLMMLRLCGARIVPYLDDTIASIFSALNNFHGYPRLVELLFQVLKAVVDESRERPDLTITDGLTAADHTITHAKNSVLQVSDIVNDLRKRRSRKRRHTEEAEGIDGLKQTPHRPWKEKTENEEEEEGEEDDSPSDIQDGNHNPGPKGDEKLSKTHRLLLAIAQSTSPHMSSPAPQVRHLTLDLIEQVAPLLARDENTFLPLINAIWPSIVARLVSADDGGGGAAAAAEEQEEQEEASYNICAAAHTIAALCNGAGSFMSSRIDAIFPRLRKLFNRVSSPSSSSASASKHTSTSQGMTISSSTTAAAASKLLLRTSKSQILAALLDLLVTILTKVQVSDDVGDEIVAMLAPFATARQPTSLPQQGGLPPPLIRPALEAYNADALWLWERQHSVGRQPG